jgi:putative ATP-dependent endonuclease of the OLD family
MDLVVRSILARKEDLRKLKESTQKEYEKILDPANLKDLEMLAERITGTLKTYVPTASVEMEWLPLTELEIPLPKADVKLVEDGYASPVSRTGHGLQRAFILTMLQHLALAQNNAGISRDSIEAPQTPGQEKLPSLVLAIEEPELFQHPNRQRLLATIFQTLASGSTPGVARTKRFRAWSCRNGAGRRGDSFRSKKCGTFSKARPSRITLFTGSPWKRGCARANCAGFA